MHTMLTEELDSQLHFNQIWSLIQELTSVHCTILLIMLKQTITHLKNLMSLKQFSGIMVQLVYFKYEKHEKYTI